MALKELSKFKEKLKNAESTKAQAFRELEKANRTLQELTGKLETISESKQAIIQATEDAKSRAKELEEEQSSTDSPHTSALRKEADSEREQYKASAGELIFVKQELTNLRQDFDAALEKKVAAFQEAADSQHIAKVNQEKVSTLTDEIAAMRGALNQVKVACAQAQKDHYKLIEEKDAQIQSLKTAKTEMDNKIQAMKEEVGSPRTVGNLEKKMEETTEAIRLLREQLKDIRDSDEESLKKATTELEEARKTLHEILAEQNSLQTSMQPLKLETENAKRENAELKQKEIKEELMTKTLKAELEKCKEELEAALIERANTGNDSENQQTKLQELTLEIENARRELDEMNRNIELLKEEAETSRANEKEVQEKLEIALKQAEEAKSAEKAANEKMHNSTGTNEATTNGKIRLSAAEFESLKKKVKEAETTADMKVATAMAQVDSINANERNALAKLEESLKETEDLEADTKDALKAAELADAAKQAIEIELQRLRQLEQKKVDGETSSVNEGEE